MNHPAACHLPTRGFVALQRLAALLLVPVLAVPLQAQTETGTLAGKVIDSANQSSLSGALVRVVGTDIETATDREGNFWFSSLPVGSHTVRISYLGLEAKEFPVTIIGGQQSNLDARLGEEIVRLSEFTVSGQREGQARALNEQRASDKSDSASLHLGGDLRFEVPRQPEAHHGEHGQRAAEPRLESSRRGRRHWPSILR